MFRDTPYGRTNTHTGEILDLAPLRYKPRGRVKRAARRSYRKGEHVLVSWRFIAIASLMLLFLSN
jgi:hypothetical protein